MNNNSDIDVYFIDNKKNDSFSYFKGVELQNLIVEIENFYLMYRKKLNLPKYVTFGMEIEYEGILKFIADKFIDKNPNLNDWISAKDGSLTTGGEIKTPKFKDTERTWEELKLVCQFLKKLNAITTKNAAGHIHIGAHVLGDDVQNWIKFLKLYASYESILFRFLYGDKISGRRKLLNFAKPMSDEIKNALFYIESAKMVQEIRCHLPDGKYQAINFQHIQYYNIDCTGMQNTLEFRAGNATVEEVVWQNNVNALTKMMLAVKKSTFDIDFIDYKLRNERISSENDFYMYNEVCLKNVLEFVDLVFDNNLDKIYFLRQYIKGFEDNSRFKTAVKSKNFIDRRKM